MAYAALENDMSTGMDGFPPSAAIGPYSSKTKINGKYIQLKGYTKYSAHTLGTVTHTADQRIVATASTTLKIEGRYVARIGDTLTDNDSIATGSSNTNIGSQYFNILSENGDQMITEAGIELVGNL